MKRGILPLFLLVQIISLHAQVYTAVTDQTDSFSVALVKLLNCGISDFRNCGGDTVFMGFQRSPLSTRFPGSRAGVIESDDNEHNAYVEFGNYVTKHQLAIAMKQLVGKIKKALGKQVNVTHELLSGPDSAFFISSIGIRDDHGFFQTNIELMSSSLEENHLLKQDQSVKKSKEQYFILMKIEGGVPQYYYCVPPGITGPENRLDNVLKTLVGYAANDFDSLYWDYNLWVGTHKKKKDTTMMNGYRIVMNYKNSNFTANMEFPLSDDNDSSHHQWEIYQQAIQSAVGPGYCYYFSELSSHPCVSYFSKEDPPGKPRIYLVNHKEPGQPPFIQLSVISGYYHPVSRDFHF